METTCPHCHEKVRVSTDEIRAWRTSHGAYLASVCPRCNDPAAKPMTRVHLAAPKSIGTPIHPDVGDTQMTTVLPQQPLPSEAPPLGWDHLIDFHHLLQRSDSFERLVHAGS